MELKVESLISFLNKANSSSATGGNLEIEASFGLNPGCEVEHTVVPYPDFYRCFSNAVCTPGVKPRATPPTRDVVYDKGILRRFNVNNESVLIRKTAIAKPLRIPVNGLWKFAMLKLRAKYERRLPDDTITSEPKFERTKERRSLFFPEAPLWRVDFTRVSRDNDLFQHEIEVELDQFAISKAQNVTTAVIVEQFQVVVDRLLACMKRS